MNNYMLAKKLAENGLIPESMKWLSDEHVMPHLEYILEKQIDVFYKAKECMYLYDLGVIHYEKDVRDGRVIPLKRDVPPDGMYS